MDYNTLATIGFAATTATTAYFYFTKSKEKHAKKKAVLEMEFFKGMAEATAKEWARDNKAQNLEIMRLTEEHTGLIEVATKLERQKKQNLRNANIAKKLLKAMVKKAENNLYLSNDQLAELREEAANADETHLKSLKKAFMEGRKHHKAKRPDIVFAEWAGTLKFW